MLRFCFATILTLLPLASPQDLDQRISSENVAKTAKTDPLYLSDGFSRYAPRVKKPLEISAAEVKELAPLNALDVRGIAKREGEVVKVAGYVDSTYIPRGKSPIMLNMGEDHRSCFKVVIFNRAYDRWEGNEEAIAGMYEKQAVVVDGIVAIYNDLPQIVVTLPSEIQVIKK